jgi:hypothetical protein
LDLGTHRCPRPQLFCLAREVGVVGRAVARENSTDAEASSSTQRQLHLAPAGLADIVCVRISEVTTRHGDYCCPLRRPANFSFCFTSFLAFSLLYSDRVRFTIATPSRCRSFDGDTYRAPSWFLLLFFCGCGVCERHVVERAFPTLKDLECLCLRLKLRRFE